MAPPMWARIEGDNFLHVSMGFSSKTLCGKKEITKFIATSIPEPKVVDCPDCLMAGAYNVPTDGRYFATCHSAVVIR